MGEGTTARRRFASVIVLVMFLLAIALAVWHDLSKARASQPGNRPIEAREDDFVTSNSCRACHPSNYASWHTSFHRTMTQVATPETLVSKAPVTELEFAGRQYRLERTTA